VYNKHAFLYFRLHRNIVKLFGTIEEKELPNGDAK
jgi:hypothetical protein